MYNWVTIQAVRDGRIQTVALAYLKDGDSKVVRLGDITTYLPEEIPDQTGEKPIRLTDGLAYLLALPSYMDSPYGQASNLEGGPELPSLKFEDEAAA